MKPDDMHATPESIAEAKDAARLEREEVYRATGVRIDEQGHIHLQQPETARARERFAEELRCPD
jgi:hypothetical protein